MLAPLYSCLVFASLHLSFLSLSWLLFPFFVLFLQPVGRKKDSQPASPTPKRSVYRGSSLPFCPLIFSALYPLYLSLLSRSYIFFYFFCSLSAASAIKRSTATLQALTPNALSIEVLPCPLPSFLLCSLPSTLVLSLLLFTCLSYFSLHLSYLVFDLFLQGVRTQKHTQPASRTPKRSFHQICLFAFVCNIVLVQFIYTLFVYNLFFHKKLLRICMQISEV